MLYQSLMQRQKNSQNSLFSEDVHLQDQVNLAVVTWNLYGSLPPNSSIQKLFHKIINENFKEPPDLILIATQQCERSLAMSFFCEDKSVWENNLTENAPGYALSAVQTLQGLHNAVLVRKDQLNCFTVEKKEVLRAGACNILGNKGAVSIIMNILGQNIQFINCHLAAQQSETESRNETLMRITSELVEKDKRTQIILCGDLNYRIEMEKETYQQSIKSTKNTQATMKYSQLQDKDQLSNQQVLKTRFLPFYQEGSITFPPTYKMGVNQNEYNNERIPGWTDRIFYRKGRLSQIFYGCEYEIFGSDHRPVVSGFKVGIEEGLSIFPQEFVGVGGGGCKLI